MIKTHVAKKKHIGKIVILFLQIKENMYGPDELSLKYYDWHFNRKNNLFLFSSLFRIFYFIEYFFYIKFSKTVVICRN